ncbi:hypothetical protein Q1695_001334 [Nippostrongylus brasiliensis]|nr:hypothetical protein Q1695_001334 [Nippostrongylus brasiliensis]
MTLPHQQPDVQLNMRQWEGEDSIFPQGNRRSPSDHRFNPYRTVSTYINYKQGENGTPTTAIQNVVVERSTKLPIPQKSQSIGYCDVNHIRTGDELSDTEAGDNGYQHCRPGALFRPTLFSFHLYRIRHYLTRLRHVFAQFFDYSLLAAVFAGYCRWNFTSDGNLHSLVEVQASDSRLKMRST